jgi:hypothetical protein
VADLFLQQAFIAHDALQCGAGVRHPARRAARALLYQSQFVLHTMEYGLVIGRILG